MNIKLLPLKLTKLAQKLNKLRKMHLRNYISSVKKQKFNEKISVPLN